MSNGSQRLDYLDGLRGLSAMQVMLFHYALAFDPAWLRGPGRFIDGDFAVFMFFIMSGFVLTFSFEREPSAIMAGMGSRIVRLGVPCAAACLIGYALQAGWPLDPRPAFERAGTLPQLAHYGSPRTPLMALFDASGLPLLFGYSNTTLFGFLAPLLPPQYTSVDGVIWSLHIELWGSALVLALVWFRARSRALYLGVAALCAVAFGGNALNLFLVGNLLAVVSRRKTYAGLRWAGTRSTLGIALLLMGEIVWLRPGSVPKLWRIFELPIYQGMATPYSWFNWHLEFAAVIVFAAFLTSPLLRYPLTSPPVLWAGRLSFPIYLVHVPIMMTIGSGVFVASSAVSATAASVAALVIGVAVTLAAAVALEKWIDRPAIAAARRCRNLSLGLQDKLPAFRKPTF